MAWQLLENLENLLLGILYLGKAIERISYWDTFFTFTKITLLSCSFSVFSRSDGLSNHHQLWFGLVLGPFLVLRTGPLNPNGKGKGIDFPTLYIPLPLRRVQGQTLEDVNHP